MQWPAMTGGSNPRLSTCRHRVSRCLLAGSSDSSQWRSTWQPCCSARSRASRTERSPSSRLDSWWGMAPTASTPAAAAQRSPSSRPGPVKTPSWGKATTCRSHRWATSSRSASSVSTPTLEAVSAWVRILVVPCATHQRIVWVARAPTSSAVSVSRARPQFLIPSWSVPLTLGVRAPSSAASR